MKKIAVIGTILMISTLMISTQVMALTCAEAGGTIVKGNNGTEYCKSTKQMNWWTALAWCKKIGMNPVRYPQDCECETAEGVPCPDTSSGCPNFKGVGSDTVWTATPSGSANAFSVNLSSGVIKYYDGRNGSGHYTLCFKDSTFK